VNAARDLAAAAIAFAALAGCGKPEAPKVDAATERAEATERAKQRAYGGSELKALEKAKGLEADINKKAEEGVERADQYAK
jgi:hypothetical protein